MSDKPTLNFSEVKVGEEFTFTTGPRPGKYRKVSKTRYVYSTDPKGVWKYWAPEDTKVRYA